MESYLHNVSPTAHAERQFTKNSNILPQMQKYFQVFVHIRLQYLPFRILWFHTETELLSTMSGDFPWWKPMRGVWSVHYVAYALRTLLCIIWHWRAITHILCVCAHILPFLPVPSMSHPCLSSSFICHSLHSLCHVKSIAGPFALQYNGFTPNPGW